MKPKFCLIPLFVDSGECYDPGAAMKKKGGVNDAALSQVLAEPELPQKRINWDLPSQSFRMECPGPAGLFVQLSPDRRRFELDGSPFFFTGCNSYYLMTRAADPGLQQQVLEVLDDACRTCNTFSTLPCLGLPHHIHIQKLLRFIRLLYRHG